MSSTWTAVDGLIRELGAIRRVAPQFSVHERLALDRAIVEAAQAIGFSGSGRHKNYGDAGQRRICANSFGDVQSAVSRHHDVEYHQGRTARVHLVQKPRARRKPRNSVPGGLKMVLQQAGNIGIILQNEDGGIQGLGHAALNSPRSSAQRRVEHLHLVPRKLRPQQYWLRDRQRAPAASRAA
jgi:hypothetical protein